MTICVDIYRVETVYVTEELHRFLTCWTITRAFIGPSQRPLQSFHLFEDIVRRTDMLLTLPLMKLGALATYHLSRELHHGDGMSMIHSR